MKKPSIFLKENQKLILQIALSLFFLGMGVFFFRHEQAELTLVKVALIEASFTWVAFGFILMLFYVLVMAWMYQFSFRAIDQNVSLSTAILLFLKRNLVSVFLPAGVLTNMVFFNHEVEKKEKVSRTQIYYASSVFTICSILSTLIIGLPVLIYLLLTHLGSGRHMLGIVVSIFLMIILYYILTDIRKEGMIYKLITGKFPSMANQFAEFKAQQFNTKDIVKVLLLSVLIELIGIVHLYISMTGITGHASFEASILGYSVVLLLLMSSPFLRGIGAIEVSLTYMLMQYGFSNPEALSITFLFRFFEFWSILVLGVFSFLIRKDSLFLRIWPAILLFFLGIVNVISVLTPAIATRMISLRNFLPLAAIHASIYLVLFSGFLMFILAVYLIKGLRAAWSMSLVLSLLSFVGHIFKGIDYEEAVLALITFVSLYLQRKQYYVRSDYKLANRVWLPGLISLTTVVAFGTIAFFFLDEKHFNADFTLKESFGNMISALFLVNSGIKPVTGFGHQFLWSINILGVLTWVYLAFIFLRPYILQTEKHSEEDIELAELIVEEFGDSNLDYFKTYADKKYWFDSEKRSVVSFKNTNNYAIVLENPVVKPGKSLESAITEFDKYCENNSLRTAYYRVLQKDIDTYESLGKKVLPIGQEAFINLETFSLVGGQMKAFRNAVSKVTKSGYTFQVNRAPQKDGFLQQLKAVSDSWLKEMDRDELAFSQGIFDFAELKSHTILSVQNEEEKVVAFVNVIPGGTPDEANFDLMRKTEDAPGGAMDFLFINMFSYFKDQGYKTCTLGLAPLSGISEPANMQERVIKLAYEKIKRFSAYRNLRFYKEKYQPEWKMRYLVYSSPFDLLFLPAALERVMRV